MANYFMMFSCIFVLILLSAHASQQEAPPHHDTSAMQHKVNETGTGPHSKGSLHNSAPYQMAEWTALSLLSSMLAVLLI